MCIKFLRKAKKLIVEIDVSEFDDEAMLALQEEITDSFKVLYKTIRAKNLSDTEDSEQKN